MAVLRPAVSEAVLKTLPPQPDASVVKLSEEGEEEEVYLDLLARGRVVGPNWSDDDDATGVVGAWEAAWRASPLVMHDAGLVAVAEATCPDLAYLSAPVSIDTIGLVLENHPGPVGCLRVDASNPSPEIMEGWMDIIRAKEEDREDAGGGERELMLLNTTQAGPRAKNYLFPLGCLPRGLTKLTLGFVAVDPLEAVHLTNLAQLTMTSCAFCGQKLSALLPALHSLTRLVLGCCYLTPNTGPAPADLTVVSSTLTRLEMSNCKASAGLNLQYTPRLAILCTGLLPRHAGARLLIHMINPVALRELHGVMLHHHDIDLVTYQRRKTIRGFPSLPNLATLRVCLHMATSQQTLNLLRLLKCMPRLTRLILTLVDDTRAPEDVPPQPAFDAISCIANSLQQLTLDRFLGGEAEIVFATRVLAAAARLASLMLRPHMKLPRDQAAAAVNALLECPRAAPACVVDLATVPLD